MKKDRKDYYNWYNETHKEQRKIHYLNRTIEQKKRYRQQYKKKMDRRRHWISKYKISKGCFICGYNKYACSLDFDHLDPKKKKFEITKYINVKLKNLFEEIRKCQILCANCHRAKDLNYTPKLIME